MIFCPFVQLRSCIIWLEGKIFIDIDDYSYTCHLFEFITDRFVKQKRIFCLIFTRRVWLLHAECNFPTQCDFDTQEWDYDTHDCHFNTHKKDFYTQSVILSHMSVIMTLTSVIYIRTSVIYKRTNWISPRSIDFKTNQLKLT
jgi:hypothetical protein